MSQQRNVEVKCPHCGRPGTYEVWDSINVDLDPELRAKILNEELFEWKCPHCGETVFAPYGFIYHDMKHKFMLFYDPDEPEGKDKYEPFQMEPVMQFMEGYIARPVYGIWNLKEKIFMLEHGLNEIALERVKYMLRHYIVPDMFQELEMFRFYQIGPDPHMQDNKDYLVFLMKSVKHDHIETFPIGVSLYEDSLTAVKIDPRFQNIGAQCIDEEWVAQKLKGVE
jgi:predicted RNA-binding Zn-ribbon protein involved in translation (DUF1610 family)